MKTIACCESVPVAFDPEAFVAWSAKLKAIAHPVRLQILSQLNRARAGVCVCDIEVNFDLSQPTISHHLRLLRQAGLVDTVQKGPWVHYSLNKEALDAIRSFLSSLEP